MNKPFFPSASLALSLLATLASPLALAADKTTAVQANNPDQEDWVELFNGRDLTNWTIKMRGHPVGENALDTFRVAEGLLQIRYDNYPKFDEKFGHIFANSGPYSYYLLQLEYRFVGAQVNEGPGWALRNNGIMYHAQAPQTMALMQDFPLSLEYQLLGGDGKNPRTTGNLCTPGTLAVIKGKLNQDHCILSSSKTYHGDQWVKAELRVLGSELAQHRINGELVFEHTDLQTDDGSALSQGYIALQAESHPTDFRVVRILNLEGCMDEKAKNFKRYLVKNNPKACEH